MKRQKVIRTYPSNYTSMTGILQEALDQGYVIVMCNKTMLTSEVECLEYIVEKDIPEQYES